ncbi:MAG: LCP family protein [Culicoidibacterales bacterium]
MLKKVLIGIVIVSIIMIVTVGGIIGGFVWYAQSELNYTTVNPEDVGVRTDHEFIDQGIVNVALFGVDARTETEVGRSDSMMILTLNPQTNKIYLTSLMRDMLVPIPGHGNDKLNHAYAYGGPTQALQVLNDVLDLNIQYYASVDFQGLQKVVDAIGGVAIDIDSEELVHMQSVGITTTGVHQLTGEQALAYSRIRYATGGDYARTQRQQEVILSLGSSLNQIGINGAMTLVSELLPNIETNIDMGTMFSLGTTAVGIGLGQVDQLRFPEDGTFTSGINPESGLWVIETDLSQMKTDLHARLTQ